MTEGIPSSFLALPLCGTTLAGLRKLRSVADGWLEEARPVLQQDFVTGRRMAGARTQGRLLPTRRLRCTTFFPAAIPFPHTVLHSACAGPADDQLGRLEQLIASGSQVGLAMEQVEILKANVEASRAADATVAPGLILRASFCSIRSRLLRVDVLRGVHMLRVLGLPPWEAQTSCSQR